MTDPDRDSCDSHLYAHIRLDAFLAALADGWRFIDDVAEPERGHHGDHACLMWRADAGEGA